MAEKEYMIDRENCAKNIRGVCPYCGGPRTPIETVDNADNPTYWPGCESCERFCAGVHPRVYLAAKQLVEVGRHRTRLDNDIRDDIARISGLITDFINLCSGYEWDPVTWHLITQKWGDE